MATTALETTTFEPTRFFEEKAPRGFEPSVKVVVRVSGLRDFRETTEDRRRRPQVNPTPSALSVFAGQWPRRLSKPQRSNPTRFSKKSAKWVRAERQSFFPRQRASRFPRDDRGSPKATAGQSHPLRFVVAKRLRRLGPFPKTTGSSPDAPVQEGPGRDHKKDELQQFCLFPF